MEFYPGEVSDDLLSAPQLLPLLEGTSAAASSSYDPSIACSFQDTVDPAEILTGVLTTAVSTMFGQSAVVEDHIALNHAVDKAVQRLMAELRPVV